MRLDERGGSCDAHIREPVHRDGVAGDSVERWERQAGPDGVRAAVRCGACGAGAVRLVRPAVGSHRLRSGRHRAARLRHRRLRFGLRGVQRRRRCAARDAGRVHARRRRHGLLRRQPGRRLQPAHGHRARGQLRRHVPAGRLRRRLERALPPGAPRRRRSGLPERVRRLRQARVLLQGRVRQPQHLRAHGVLAAVQVSMPQVVQLRLRRPHQHLHLRRRPRLHHHLLPSHLPKSEIEHRSNDDDTDDDDARDGHKCPAAAAEAGGRPGWRPRRDARRQFLACKPRLRRRIVRHHSASVTGRTGCPALAPASPIGYSGSYEFSLLSRLTKQKGSENLVNTEEA